MILILAHANLKSLRKVSNTFSSCMSLTFRNFGALNILEERNQQENK